MEWVETTAKTVAEAQDLALDKLGVDELEAEFEILEEPKQGLFGRVRGQARVRARVAPKSPREKEDRGRRRKKPKGDRPKGDRSTGRKSKTDDSDRSADRSTKSNAAPNGRDAEGRETAEAGNDSENKSDRGSRGRSAKQGNGRGGNGRARNERRPEQPKEESPMEDVQSTVEEFLTGLTAAFGLEAPVEMQVSEDEIVASIQGKHGLLLGPKARTLDAIQELTRVTAQRSAPSSIRIKVDVGGYREQRKLSLQGFANKAADKAVEEGIEVVLEPMSSADRKVVHDSLNDHAGVSTRSAGTDPRRYVIVVPNQADSEDGNDDA